MPNSPDTSPKPWTPSDGEGGDPRRHAPATLRNRDAIVDVLRDIVPTEGTVLEIASGSGEHALYFAHAFPALRWQPSDPDPAALRSIAAWLAEDKATNVAAPTMIDVSSDFWPIEKADAILCINMIHISPWQATLGLMRGAARILPVGGALYLYGPFLREGVQTASSNIAFDISLRDRDPRWGLRDVSDVTEAAEKEGLRFERLVEMPANNLSLIYRRA